MSKDPTLNLSIIRAACSAGDLSAIKDLSTTLSSNLRHRRSRSDAGKTHLASTGKFFSDSLLRHFTYRMLRSCQSNDLSPPLELIELLQLVLSQDRPPSKSDRKYIASLEAREFLKTNPDAGIREIAREVGVAPSTVTRWKRDSKL